jgi:hypothetical protein
MVIGKPAPFVSAFVDAVDAAIRTHQPHHALSVTQRTWLAFCITAVLVTNSICWARFARASLGTYAMAALSWMFRHSKIPWEQLLIASVRVILRHHGITSGTLVIDDTDNPRSKSAKALAYLYKLRDKESGGYLWGQSLVFLVLVTPKISMPVGVGFYQPAPEQCLDMLDLWGAQVPHGWVTGDDALRRHTWFRGELRARVVSLNCRDEVLSAEYHKIRASQGDNSPLT